MKKLILVPGTVGCINEGLSSDAAGIVIPVYCGKAGLEFGVNRPDFETTVKNVDPSNKMVLLNVLNAKYVDKRLLCSEFNDQLEALKEKFSNLLASTGNMETLRALRKMSSEIKMVAPIVAATRNEYEHLISKRSSQIKRVVEAIHNNQNVILDWRLPNAEDLNCYYSGIREAIGDDNRLIVVENDTCNIKTR